jgi:lambda repressor-like predicted transcriptional regulator
MDKPNRILDSEEHKREVETLQRFWAHTTERRKIDGGESLRAFAKKHGFESYSTVSSCLKGHMALSLKTARLFAAAFGVSVEDISPRWHRIVSEGTPPSQDSGESPRPHSDDALIQQIIDALDQLPPHKRQVVLMVATALLPDGQAQGQCGG